MDSPLVPFDHTYILYSPGNPLSLPLAASSLIPILILVFLFSWHVITREIEPCIFAAGHVCNDIISGICKHLVKYPRPLNGQVFKKDGGLVWGMPSSHSQFMSFWFMYTILTFVINNPCYGKGINKWQQVGYTFACMGMVAVVVASRIVFEYHNWCQVIVGLMLGLVLASGYYTFVSILREYGVVDLLIVNIPGFKWWGVKDTFGRGCSRSVAEERKEWEAMIR